MINPTPRIAALLVAFICCFGLAAQSARAGIIIYQDEDGSTMVEVGGRIQIQYLNTDAIGEERRDQIFFRRLRPYIMATVTEDWIGKIAVDFGKSLDNDEVSVKDAYMQYTGWNNLKFTIGNAKPFFSREYLTSSKRTQTIERGFVGDHNFATPDRALGFRLEGQNESKKVTWGASAGASHHDPDVRRIDFDTPVNNLDDWNEGLLVSGRIDIHPRGFMKFDQGDFHSDEFKYNFSLAAFTWANDNDNNTYTDDDGLSLSDTKADLDTSTGFELSAGLRGFGWSFDVEYHLITADTVVRDFAGSIYMDGTADIDEFQVEGGYMLPGNKFELAGKYQTMAVDAWEKDWQATEVGVNYFLNEHKAKVQLTYRKSQNVFGVDGEDADNIFVQFQFVF